jgi:hypothetical protein
MEVAFGKMRAADLVVIRLDGVVLGGLQHGEDFRLCCQLEEVIIMPGVSSEPLSVAFEQLYLTVDSKHLFDEGSPEVEQPHWE